MKKNLFILCFSLLIFSCGNEREESKEKTEECVEDKFDDELSKFETIEEAITAYDFESARILLGCYEDACFKGDNRQDKCPTFRGGYNDIASETKKEWAGRKSQQNEHFKMLYKIVSAEVAYFIKNGDVRGAKNSALESDMFFIYKKALPGAINGLIDNNKSDEALAILSKYTFEYSYDLSKAVTGRTKKLTSNENYNKEANFFNDMINSVFTTALFNADKTILKKCTILFVPLTKGIKGKNGLTFNSKLIYTYKEAAKSKLNESGITL